jgi:DNA-binding NarL/FixJ family response regulator
MTIGVYLVDDALETIEALTTVYSAHPKLQVVGSVYSGRETLRAVRANLSQIDIVSLDIQLGDANGIELCRQIRQEFPHLFIVMCSLQADWKTRQLAAEAGAHYFLSKPFGLPEVNEMVAAYRDFTKRTDTGYSAEAIHKDSDWLESLLSLLDKKA